MSRDFLSDDEISPEEYADALVQISECVSELGSSVSIEERYGLSIFSSTDESAGEALDRCESSGLGDVRAQYEAHYTDPRNEGDTVYLDCFYKVGLIPADSPSAESMDEAIDSVLDSSNNARDFKLADRCMYDPQGHTW